jgi:hypothetical protein
MLKRIWLFDGQLYMAAIFLTNEFGKATEDDLWIAVFRTDNKEKCYIIYKL